MSDIGLGILNKRTIITIFLLCILFNAIFHYQIPFVADNTEQLLLYVVLFTGYVYLARSVVIIIFGMIIGIISGLVNGFGNSIGPIDFIKNTLSGLNDSLTEPEDWQDWIVGFIDRLSLLPIIWVAMHPDTTTTARFLGFGGILFMIIIYMVYGTFSFAVEDNLGD